MEAARSDPGLPEEVDYGTAMFQRRIEFRLESRPFNGFAGVGGDGFNLITLNPNAETPKEQAGTPNEPATSSKPERTERMDSGVDPEFSVEISFRRIGAGLRNLGNTCFLNSVLQCLTYTEPLAAYLQSGKHQISCRKAGFCALCAIQKHVSRALESTGRILEPKDLVSNLRNISRNFRNARQEDAHEYMVNLLESMHKCCLPSGVPSESPFAYKKSLVHRIFGGYLRSQVECLECSFCSEKLDPFLDLSLEIVKADSIKKALSRFTSKEQLDEGARHYQCQNCKNKVKAHKRLTVHEAPNVLSIHLKRFSEHDPGKKINKHIAFETTLDLKPFLTGPCDGDLSYTLYGVLVHDGWNTHSGHYYCFVRTSSGMWYSLDDNQVVQVNERTVLNQKAYILFYFRDRKTLCTMKSADIKKGNMVVNAIGNSTCLNLNAGLKGKIQSDLAMKKIDDVVAPALISGATPVFASAPVGTNLEKECAEKSKSVVDISSGLEQRPHSEIFPAAPETSSATVVSVGKEVSYSESKEKIQSGSVVNMAGVLPPRSDTSAVSFSSAKKKNMEDCAGKSKVAVAHSSCGLESSSAVPQTIDTVTRCRDAPDVSLEANGVSSDLPVSSVSADLACRKSNKRQRPHAVKKGHLKHITSISSLSSRILVHGLLWGTRRKKLHKGIKQHSVRKKDSSTDSLVDGSNSTSTDVPSVSGEPSSIKSVEIAQSPDNVNSATGPKSRGGNVQVSSVVSPVFPSASQMPDEESRGKSRQEDIVSMLTRGLVEIRVPRWEDTTDASPAEAPVGKHLQIGYVGDEWDEEYDRGKRKKIRNAKAQFDGPNPFQEIATRNQERMRAKLQS